MLRNAGRLIQYLRWAICGTICFWASVEASVLPSGIFSENPAKKVTSKEPRIIRPAPSIPIRSAANAISNGPSVENLPPQSVGLYTSLSSQEQLMRFGMDPTTGTRIWENYLRGKKIAFARLRSPADIEQLPPTSILLLPSILVMSEVEKTAVLKWRNRGGSVLSTWQTATVGESGGPAGYGFMADVLDVEVKGTTEDADEDDFVITHGDTPISYSLPAGTRMRLRSSPNQWPLRMVGKQEAATIMNWARSHKAQTPSGLLTYNERQMPTGQLSRTVTLGFAEQNWPNTDPKQLDALLGHIFSWLNHLPQAYLGAWPYPYQSALLLAVLAAEELADVDMPIATEVKAMKGQATYYVHAGNALKAAPVIKKVRALGHTIAYFGDVFEGFKDQPEAVQAKRLAEMQQQLQKAGLIQPGAAGFSAPLDSYDQTTLRLLQEQKFDSYLALMDLTESSLPFFANRDASGAGQTVVLPRTLIGPEDALFSDADFGFENFIGGMKLSARMGTLAVVGIPSQTLLMPAQRKRILDEMRALREQTWIASANQIAQWWRNRDRVSIAFAPHPQGYVLSATVARTAPNPEPVSIWVTLPKRNSKVRLEALNKGDKLPTIHAVDPWRVAIVMQAPRPGQTQWLLKFDEPAAPGKP
jgi:hypothetical protein